MAHEQVLIVDHNAQERQRFHELLELAEYRVADADGEVDGCELAKRLQPAVVLIAPTGSRTEASHLVQQLKADPITCAIPILIVSSLPHTANEPPTDIVEYVDQPASPTQLMDAVRRAVWRWRTHQPPRVLIADDEPDTIDILATVFRHEGFVTLEAADGAQALELIRRERPDIVILDVSMPGIDGWQALKALKHDEQLRAIPVVMLTGIALSPQDEETALALGAARYLTKPFTPESVVHEITRTLQAT